MHFSKLDAPMLDSPSLIRSRSQFLASRCINKSRFNSKATWSIVMECIEAESFIKLTHSNSNLHSLIIVVVNSTNQLDEQRLSVQRT